MRKLPPSLTIEYSKFIEQYGIPLTKRHFFLKWLRFYKDFCHKYNLPPLHEESLTSFIEKLREKNQAEGLRKQARNAVELFWDMWGNRELAPQEKIPTNNKSLPSTSGLTHNKVKTYSQAVSNSRNFNNVTFSPVAVEGNTIKTSNVNDWSGVYSALENTIKLRHYSPKTLKSYTTWTRKFQTFLENKNPDLIEVEDVKSFLTFLAVKQRVSASSQNLAFNSLLFLFRNVFDKEFGKVDGIVRAKKKPYIPVVLSRREIEKVLDVLSDPYKLIIKLMYGCGLRISECLSLRVQNFNFDMMILTIHDGKGKKDRTVPIPETLLKELLDQLDFVIRLHSEDCESGYSGVFLVNQLEKKYKNAAKELVWQWFFPAKNLTFIPKLKQYRRYRIHDTVLQKALRNAVRKANIPKRVTAHTFRHSFASHLLQANYDIRTIQELMGHSDIRTTMIYTHTVKSTTKKEAQSPLDFDVN